MPLQAEQQEKALGTQTKCRCTATCMDQDERAGPCGTKAAEPARKRAGQRGGLRSSTSAQQLSLFNAHAKFPYASMASILGPPAAGRLLSKRLQAAPSSEVVMHFCGMKPLELERLAFCKLLHARYARCPKDVVQSRELSQRTFPKDAQTRLQSPQFQHAEISKARAQQPGLLSPKSVL